MSAPDDESLTRTVIARTGNVPTGPAAADDDRAHYLVVVEGEERGRRIEVGENAVIGRAKPADIVLPDPLVSRNHCRVGIVMGELFVTDLGSSNGTFVGTQRVSSRSHVPPGARVSIGSHVLEHEWRSRREVQEAHALDSDIERAKQYVRSLLPPQIEVGPVRTDWVLQPSAKLGGDMFGYHYLDDHTFAMYLLDVTGHGTNAAMHAVSVMNVLRKHAMPGVDVRDPARMAEYLNQNFQMESHGGLLLSLWYGVFDLAARTVAFTSGGHHPAFLVDASRDGVIPLDVTNALVGMIPGYVYRTGHAGVPPGSSLYLFSDGVFEIDISEDVRWTLDDLVPHLAAPKEPGKPESRRILDAVKAATARQVFEDDFTLVVATFG